MAAKKSEEKKLVRSLEASGFYSDAEKEGCLYAALVRSPAPSGKIKSITAPDLPEGYVLYTSKDLPGSKSITANKSLIKFFCYGNVSYSGEPVGIIFGPDEGMVHQLLDTVSINFDVENLESALNNVINNQEEASNMKEFIEQINEMPSLDTVIDKSHVEENTSVVVAEREIKYGLYKRASLAQADTKLFEKADFTSTDTWKERLLTPKWQETEGAFAYTEGEKIHVFAPTRWTGFTQKAVATALNIDEALVYIHKTKSPGIYPSGLARTTQLAVQVAAASWLSKKPVKLILSQYEQENFMVPGVITDITYRSALNKEGRLIALKINIDIDIGCSNPFAQEITDRIAIAATNYYKPENLYIHAQAHTSKNPPTSISMQIIESQAFFAIENEIQKLSNLSKIFPDELRLINTESPKAFPFNIPTGEVQAVIQTALKNSDFNRKYASFHMEAIDRAEKDSKPFFALPLRGIGLATAYIPSGYYGQTSFSNDAKLEVTLNADEKLQIHAIKPSDVIQDIWKTTAAEIIQIPKQNIQINSDFPYDQIPEQPEDSYCSISIMNELVKKCCNDIQKKRFHQPLPLTAKRSAVMSSKTKFDKEKFSGTPYHTTSFITTVVEVELDTYTYNEKIKGIWVTVDCGELFDEAAALRTIKLEIQQELTMLVKGKTVLCDAINISFIQSSNRSGQVGGLIHNTLPAAFSSALSLALTTQLTEIPCTEDLLFQLIRDRTNEKNKGEAE